MILDAILFIANGLFSGAVGGVIATVLNHQLARRFNRDREINEAAKPLRIHFIADVERPRVGNSRPSIFEIDLFEQALTPRDRKRFRAEYEAYQQARRRPYSEQGPDSSGQVTYTPEQAAEVRTAAAVLLKFTEHR